MTNPKKYNKSSYQELDSGYAVFRHGLDSLS